MSATDALGQARAADPTAIVLDLHLPDINGLMCLRELRQRRPGPYPPVVIFTADYDVEEHASEIDSLGATIVSKLCGLDELELTLQSLATL